LSGGKPLLLDGAMGTELDWRGVRTYLPLWSAIGLVERPEIVEEIHRDHVRAGADILTTNTFRTTRRTLAKTGRDPNDAASLDRLAAELARRAAADAGRSVLVGGSIAPLEDCYTPALFPGPETALAEHRAQAESLAAAGVDFLMIETMPLIAEAKVAVGAALETGLEVTAGFVIGKDGRLLSGETLAEAVAAVSAFPVTAIFVNCSPPAVIGAALRSLRGLTALPVGGYANLGNADATTGWAADESVDGARYSAHASEWLEAGASIIGGCCGTRPEHIAAVRELLNRR
jgi:S-methylmethionine-dependent homocysteine/selenocysteine methylase